MKTTFGFGISSPKKVEKPITMEEVKRTKLLFGEHKGMSLLDVPVDYLAWLEGQKLADGAKTSDYFMRCLDFAIRQNKKR
jgi:uncharacterized protein (DUF3820 family)